MISPGGYRSPIARKVVFGHAYAIPAPVGLIRRVPRVRNTDLLVGGWCQPNNPGSRCFGTGALYPCEVCLETSRPSAAEKFDDEDYPAYTMGRAAEILGVSPGFLRSLDEAKLITPQRWQPPAGTQRCTRRSN